MLQVERQDVSREQPSGKVHGPKLHTKRRKLEHRSGPATEKVVPQSGQNMAIALTSLYAKVVPGGLELVISETSATG